MVDGDQILALIATLLACEAGRLQGNGVVATVMSNLGLERYLSGLGLDLRPHRRSATAMWRAACARSAAMSAASSPAI